MLKYTLLEYQKNWRNRVKRGHTWKVPIVEFSIAKLFISYMHSECGLCFSGVHQSAKYPAFRIFEGARTMTITRKVRLVLQIAVRC